MRHGAANARENGLHRCVGISPQCRVPRGEPDFVYVVRTTALRAFLLGGFWLLSGTQARAEVICRGPVVVVEAGLRLPWRGPVGQLTETLASWPDVERCAVVHVRPDGASAADVEVKLPDGRSATRHLQRPDELTTVVRSLVTNLPEVADAQGALLPTPTNVETQRRQTRRPRELGLGIGPSLHIMARPTFVGLGLTGDVHGVIDRWVYGAWLRWDARERAVGQQNVPSDLTMSSFLLGAFVGSRFLLGPVVLDATVGPNVVIENQEAFEGTRDDVGGDFVELSVGANLRLLAPRKAAWRGFALLGFDVYPGRIGRELRRAETLPALPAFGTTLAVGAAWSTL